MLPGIRALHLRAGRKSAHVHVSARIVRAGDIAGLAGNRRGIGKLVIVRGGRRRLRRGSRLRGRLRAGGIRSRGSGGRSVRRRAGRCSVGLAGRSGRRRSKRSCGGLLGGAGVGRGGAPGRSGGRAGAKQQKRRDTDDYQRQESLHNGHFVAQKSMPRTKWRWKCDVPRLLPDCSVPGRLPYLCP
jgi:hypothetical protein